MPMIVPALAGLLASAAVTSVLPATLSATMVTLIAGAVGLVVSTGLSLLLNKAPSVARTDAQAADRKQAVRSGIAPRNLVYGRAQVAGPAIFMASEGEYNEWLHIVMPLAGHPVHAFHKVKLNGYIIPITAYTAGGDGTTGAGVAGQQGYNTLIYVRIPANTPAGNLNPAYIRTDDYDPAADLARDAVISLRLWDGTQVIPDATLVACFPDDWSSNNKLTGLPYIALRIRFSNDVFGGGFQDLSVELDGKALWDPRDDSTGYTSNAALVVLDYLMSEYGLGIPSAEIDTAAAIAAANVCDEDVALDVGATTFQKRYTINGSFKLDQTPIDIAESMLNGWGTLVYVQGLYRIHAAAAEAADLTLTASDFAGPVDVVRNHARRELFNTITGTYIEPLQGWEPIAFPLVQSAAQVASDGEPISVTLDLPNVINAAYAQRLARLRLLTARSGGFQIRAQLKYSALRVAVWDVVAVTLPEFGLEDDPFRVTRWSFDPVSGLISLVLQSDRPEAYSWTATDAQEPILSDVTSLASPLSIPAGQTPTVAVSYRLQTDGTAVPRLAISWAVARPSPFVTMIEVQWRNSTAGDPWSSRLVPPTETATFVEPIQPTNTYQVRLRYHANLLRGPWSSTPSATGTGNETATPVAPTGRTANAVLGGYRATFTRATALDTEATEVGEDVTPYEGTINYVGETTGTTFVRNVVSGDYSERRVYLRTRNTAGQLSSWALAGTVTPQTATTVDLTANAITASYVASTTTRQQPAVGAGWVDTDVYVTVTVTTGERQIVQFVANLDQWEAETAIGGGDEGGANTGS